MADSEFILGLLESVTQRLRVLHRRQSVFSVLGIAFTFPVFLKLIDLIFPLRGSIVAIILAIWGVATIAWIFSKIRVAADMSDAAASLDRQGRLQDQMKTA